MKTLRVTLEIDVEDLPKEKREEHAADMEMPVDELTSLSDYEAPEVARVLQNFGGDMNDDLFAGSDLFIKFAAVRPQSARWLDEADR